MSEKTTPDHSPLPWRFSTDDPMDGTIGQIESHDDWSVAAVFNDVRELPAKANAEFIVRAVNSHDALLAALKALIAGDPHEWLLDHGLRKRAQDAIAKAEGR